MTRGCETLSSEGGAGSRTPANQKSASGLGVSTPCGAVLTRKTTAFVPGVLGVSTPCGAVLIRKTTAFVPSVFGLNIHGQSFDLRMGPFLSLVELAPRTPAHQQ